MSRLTFIGTLHTMLPECEEELKTVLESKQFDTLFVEISQKYIELGEFDSSPLEMQFGYQWAISKKINVFGFDCAISVVSENFSKEKENQIISKQLTSLGSKTWKEANKREMDHLSELAESIVDPIKWNKREDCMAKNIKKKLHSCKSALVLTGTGHLRFFEKEFPHASFPFRD